MTCCYRIDSERGLMLERVFGRIDDEQLLEFVDDKFGDAQYHPGIDLLADYRDADTRGITTEGLHGVIERMVHEPRSYTGSRWAIVVGDDLTFGLARMFEKLADEYPIRVQTFRDLRQAADWLGPHVWAEFVTFQREVCSEATNNN